MNISLAAEAVARSLRQHGVGGTLRRVIRYALGERQRDEFDVKNGTDTSGIEPLWKFRIDSPRARLGGRYHPTEEWELLGALKLLNEDLRSFIFVDLGCGKGRALIIAARLGFRQVIGVEFVGELAAAARRNLQIAGIANAVVLDGDAAEYSFCDGDLIVYLFNPFEEEVVRAVVANLNRPRSGKLYVIYANPRCASPFDASRVLERTGSAPARWLPTIVWRAKDGERHSHADLFTGMVDGKQGERDSLKA